MSQEIVNVVATLTALILLGTLPVLGLFLRDPKRHRDMLVRTFSWYPVSLFVMGGIALGRHLFTALFVFVSLRALLELFRAARRSYARSIWLVCVALILGHYALLLDAQWVLALVFLPVVTASILPALLMLSEECEAFASRAGVLGFWVLLSGWALGMIPMLCWIPADLGSHGWQGIVLFVVAVTQLNDLFQYVWGKLLGRRRLAYRISPGKTWEGAIGGALTMTAAGTLLGGYITPFGYARSALLALLLCVGGVLGDLLISAVKRDLGVKDLGAILPGMGGLLDRVDSLVINAPVFLLFVLLTQLP